MLFTRKIESSTHRFQTCGVLFLMLAALQIAGCQKAEPPQFRLDVVSLEKNEVYPKHQQQIANVVTAMFGTPDEPIALPETGLNIDKLRLAAGPVVTDQKGESHGLFRRHCVHCHGITGDGKGPTASFLNPYPRDFRRGIFKAKSTERVARPTTADLQRTLRQGIPGTAMPSFLLLPESERDALVEYVKYLSIRGETERSLALFTLDELDEETDLPTDSELLVGEILAGVVSAWEEAENAVIAPQAPPKMELAKSIQLGRELFQGTKANCVKCHGVLALGDGQTSDFDDWNKEIKPEDLAFGALRQRNAIPRNLRQGIFRFGRRPLDIYRRVHAGINGTPMPGTGPTSPGGVGTLSPEEIWHVVNYVRSLEYESLSRPSKAQLSLGRPRL